MSVDFRAQNIIKINVKTLENKKIWGQFFYQEQRFDTEELELFRKEKLFEGTSINKTTLEYLLECSDKVIELIDSEKNQQLINIKSEIKELWETKNWEDEEWVKQFELKKLEEKNIRIKILKDKIGNKHIFEWALENEEFIPGDYHNPFEPLKDKGDIIKIDGDWIYIQTQEPS